MNPPKESIAAYFTIYKGLVFYAKLLYQTPTGAAVDVTGWFGKLAVRISLDSPDVLFTLDTTDASLVLGNGIIEFMGPDAATTALLDWDQAVGHLVLGPTPETAKPIALFGFNVQPCTTPVP